MTPIVLKNSGRSAGFVRVYRHPSGRVAEAQGTGARGTRLASADGTDPRGREHPETELDVVTLLDAETAIAAVRSGTVDVTFRAVTVPGRHLPDGVKAARVLDEPLQLLTGPAHELASARVITPAQLAGHRIWIPGIVPGTEWAAYYDELAAAFGLTIDAVGPNFGTESLLDVNADSGELASLVGEQTRLLWPADYGLRRIAVHDPTPVYPHSLIWRSDKPTPRPQDAPHLSRHRPAPPSRRGDLDPEMGAPLAGLSDDHGLLRPAL